MTEINITIENLPLGAEGKVTKLVTFKGQLDETNVDEKAKLIYKEIETTPKNLCLLFDFEGLEYMNSKSIGYLTDWYGKISEGGGKIVIAKARPNILDILEVVGLTQLITCLPTIDEAKLALIDAQPGTSTPAATPPAPKAA